MGHTRAPPLQAARRRAVSELIFFAGTNDLRRCKQIASVWNIKVRQLAGLCAGGSTPGSTGPSSRAGGQPGQRNRNAVHEAAGAHGADTRARKPFECRRNPGRLTPPQQTCFPCLGGRRPRACMQVRDPNVMDYDKRTPLHVAAAEGAYSVVEWLVQSESCQVNPLDRHNKTPLEVRPAAWPSCIALGSGGQARTTRRPCPGRRAALRGMYSAWGLGIGGSCC